MRFDVVLAFDTDVSAILDRIRSEVLASYPGYQVLIAPDIDLTE